MISEKLVADEHFNSLSVPAQNIFIRLLAVSDDCGVVPAHSHWLKAKINPPEEYRDKLPEIMLEIAGAGLGSLVLTAGKPWFLFKTDTFLKFQSYIINKRQWSEYMEMSSEQFDAIDWSKIQQITDRSQLTDLPTSEVRRLVAVRPGLDFEAVWALYPHRSGKKSAMRHFLATVKTPEDYENLKKAMANYLGSERVKNGYVKNGSTFFNEWQDWIDPTELMMKGKSGEGSQRGASGGRRYTFDRRKYPTIKQQPDS